VILAVALAGSALYVFPGTMGASAGRQGARSYASTDGERAPVLRRDFPEAAKALSKEQYKAIARDLYRSRVASTANVEAVAGGEAVPEATAPETGPEGEGRFHGTPGNFVVGKNVLNTRADESTCGTGSTLAEPAAANEGRYVYYTGNLRHQEYSTDGGTTWTCAAAYPAGPTEAPTAFGDTDVIYDRARGVTFHSVLYVKTDTGGNITNGIIRLFVRRNINLADNCFYDVDTSPSVTNVLDDYPHLGLSNDFLYISANRLQKPGNTWLGAYVERDNLDQLADCATVDFSWNNFTNASGQRILTPAPNVTDVMYFGWVETTTSWRVFAWPDSGGATSVLKSVGTMTFGNPDCRGGTNNADWADALGSSIAGFNARTAVGNDYVSLWIQTAADASHPQAHIHGAVFRVGTSNTSLNLVQQPVVWNSTNCFGIPIANTNDRGDIALATAFGGRAGGGGSAAGTAVIMRDEFSPGPGTFSFAMIASGTHNRTDARYGDYFTVRRNTPCGLWFDATGYALNGGTALSNVNARYAEFGRQRDRQCYDAWKNAIPAT
jgi:hypothetical protein